MLPNSVRSYRTTKKRLSTFKLPAQWFVNLIRPKKLTTPDIDRIEHYLQNTIPLHIGRKKQYSSWRCSHKLMKSLELYHDIVTEQIYRLVVRLM